MPRAQYAPAAFDVIHMPKPKWLAFPIELFAGFVMLVELRLPRLTS